MRVAETSATETLVEGRRLSRRVFHALYEDAPPGTRAELIGGVVHMPGRVGSDHSVATSTLSGWAGIYRRRLPGVESLGNVSTALDHFNEVQPDVLIRRLPGHGGRTRDDEGIVHGAPELVVEVSRTSRFVDLGPKRVEYERAGVLEYVVFALAPDEVVWHVREGDSLVPVGPDVDGVHRSRAFPGLWLDPRALIAGDLDAVLTVLEQGLASPEHAAFRESLGREAAGG